MINMVYFKEGVHKSNLKNCKRKPNAKYLPQRLTSEFDRKLLRQTFRVQTTSVVLRQRLALDSWGLQMLSKVQ